MPFGLLCVTQYVSRTDDTSIEFSVFYFSMLKPRIALRFCGVWGSTGYVVFLQVSTLLLEGARESRDNVSGPRLA